MTNLSPSSPFVRRTARIWIALLIVFGMVIIAFYGWRSVRSFREIQFARENGLLDGTASLDAVRPWMTVRYVAVAYAVPEEFIFAELNIPFEERNRDDSLGELNRKYDFGIGDGPPDMPIMAAVRTAILAYRANPVATGLDDIRPWMSVQYVANSTGVPASYLLEAIGVPQENSSEFKPLDFLAHEYKVGDPRQLAEKVQAAVHAYKEGG